MKASQTFIAQSPGQEAAEAPFDAVLPFPGVYRCSKCEFSTIRNWELQSHAKETKHATFVCKTPGCTASFVVESHLQAHEAHAHVSGHSQIEPNGMFTCAECGQAFSTRAKQQSHGDNSQHSPFLCACGATFSRVDVLHRHMDSYANDVPKFPCKFCKFHRGKHGFRRRDHLVQHLRGYHKFDEEDISEACPSARRTKQRQFATCPHRGCDLFRDESFHNLRWVEQESQRPFATQGAFTKHMKEIHQQTPFPRDVEDCDKVGAKGYVREKDLMKHRTSKHPDVPGYSPKPRQSEYPCGLNGCDKTFSSAAGHFEHRYWVHWTSEQQRAYEDA
ncbi:hypothetical protein PG993_007785 [Apiospora rasikravindrae]|uniref:C2H2-type domain-containing protein n=1 Tax=Apiospora rasikravindrae TaxID=990691 RepID=A0ABR1SYG6_9PEZI